MFARLRAACGFATHLSVLRVILVSPRGIDAHVLFLHEKKRKDFAIETRFGHCFAAAGCKFMEIAHKS